MNTNNKPKIIWIIFILLIVTGLALIGELTQNMILHLEGINNVNREFTTEKPLTFLDLRVVKTVIFSLIIIILTFLCAIGTYMKKRWTWILNLMISFYLVITYSTIAINHIGNLVIPGEEMPLGYILVLAIPFFAMFILYHSLINNRIKKYFAVKFME